jgi:hypothetical protein
VHACGCAWVHVSAFARACLFMHVCMRLRVRAHIRRGAGGSSRASFLITVEGIPSVYWDACLTAPCGSDG